MKRSFSYVTVGRILDMLKEQGLSISRLTFYKLEKEGLFIASGKTAGKWRVFSPEDAELIIKQIKSNYGLGEEPKISE
jgi:DNA-binding transcriptional MerR regulator